jgi:hypothetical protein
MAPDERWFLIDIVPPEWCMLRSCRTEDEPRCRPSWYLYWLFRLPYSDSRCARSCSNLSWRYVRRKLKRTTGISFGETIWPVPIAQRMTLFWLLPIKQSQRLK